MRFGRRTFLGGRPVTLRQEADAAIFTLPPAGRDQFVPVLRLEGRGLT